MEYNIIEFCFLRALSAPFYSSLTVSFLDSIKEKKIAPI
jgi:hypothetical protein